MIFKLPDNARTDTATAQNGSNAPIIHRTARPMSGRCALLGIRLALTAAGIKDG